jgi:microcin C transport system ATP-binding protein
MIAMALACKPALLICDEPTTALDVTIQAQILACWTNCRREMGMALLFITHDLNLVRRFTHRVGVMERGRWSRSAHRGEVFAARSTPTRAACWPAGRSACVQPLPADAPVLVRSAKACASASTSGHRLVLGKRAVHAVEEPR